MRPGVQRWLVGLIGAPVSLLLVACGVVSVSQDDETLASSTTVPAGGSGGPLVVSGAGGGTGTTVPGAPGSVGGVGAPAPTLPVRVEGETDEQYVQRVIESVAASGGGTGSGGGVPSPMVVPGFPTTVPATQPVQSTLCNATRALTEFSRTLWLASAEGSFQTRAANLRTILGLLVAFAEAHPQPDRDTLTAMTDATRARLDAATSPEGLSDVIAQSSSAYLPYISITSQTCVVRDDGRTEPPTTEVLPTLDELLAPFR